jgi:hypothetical protein
LQTRGAAIGTKVAVQYKLQPKLWLRFIDDIFMMWTHVEEALLEFVEFFNSSVDSIKFTMTTSKEHVNFFDTTTKIVNG